MTRTTIGTMLLISALLINVSCNGELTSINTVTNSANAPSARSIPEQGCLTLRVDPTMLSVGDSARVSISATNPVFRSRYDVRHELISRNETILAVIPSGLRAVQVGVVNVVARSGICEDSVKVFVGPNPANLDNIGLQRIVRTGKAPISNIVAVVPVREGRVQRSTLDSISVIAGGREIASAPRTLSGTWRDGTYRAVALEIDREQAGNAELSLVIGRQRSVNLQPTLSDLANASELAIPQQSDYLVATGLFGRTIPVNRSPSPDYEAMFQRWAEFQWSTYGASWNNANYYDRAQNHFVYWARSGDSRYFSRADLLALDYRRNYLAAFDFLPAPHNMAMEGTALHYWLTGDDSSRTATIRSVDRLVGPYSPEHLSKPTYDGRVLHRMITGSILAWELGDKGRDWRLLARRYVDVALAHQQANGSYVYSGDWNGGQGNFMVGLMNDALIKYFERVDSDPRIPPSIRLSADYLWSTQWNAVAGAFQYASRPLGGSYTIKYDTPTHDLNLLIINTLAFAGYTSRDPFWRTASDIVMAGTLKSAWPQGSKQFNQLFYDSHSYLYYRSY